MVSLVVVIAAIITPVQSVRAGEAGITCAADTGDETIRETSRFVSWSGALMIAQEDGSAASTGDDAGVGIEGGGEGEGEGEDASISGEDAREEGEEAGDSASLPGAEEWGPVNLAISIVGLALLVAFVVLVIRRPRLLDKKARPCELTPMAVLPGLAWYFLLLPFTASLLANALGLFGEESTTSVSQVQQSARLQWLVHALTLPVILLWWWARRWDRWHYAADGHSAMGHGGSGRQKGPRGWMPSIGVGVLGIVVIWPIVMFVNAASAWIYSTITGESVNPVAHQTLVMLQSATLDRWTWLVIVSVVVASPVFEEIVFRGLLQSAAQSFFRRVIPAIVAASVVFSLRHWDIASPEALPGLFTLAVGMGVAYAWTGRILTPIIMHMLFNGANILLLYVLVRNS